MSKQYWVQQAESKDIPAFGEYMQASVDINEFDPDVMAYPTTRVLKVVSEDGISLFMPYQKVLMMESLAPRPGCDVKEEALALREITKAVATVASLEQMREVYFLCSDERVVEFAHKHGFEEINLKVLKLKLNKLEGRNDLEK